MNSQNEANIRLRQPWLFITRVTWLVLAFCAVITFVANLSYLLEPQNSLCNPPTIPCIRNLILPEEAALLPQIGLSLASYNLIIQLSETLLSAGMWLVVSALIFWRRSDEPIAILTAFFMIGFPFSLLGTIPNPSPILLLLSTFVTFFNGLLAILFFVFPTGQFVPKWTRWVAYVFLAIWTVRVIVYALWTFLYGNIPPTGIFTTIGNVFVLIYFTVFFLSIGSQVYRYWRVSNSIQRQQTKWILISILSLPVLDLLLRGVAVPSLFPELFKPSVAHIIYNLISNPFYVLGFFLVPIAFAISIFRYHLYSIDILIRRTLIYSSITFFLALVYLSSVILLQQVFRTMTGIGNDLAIIISTLAIAALFNPLRHRVQDAIDHRFYRRKYDAQKVLERFGATARDEVELEKLTGELLNVVNETMQPTSVSLWLKKTENGGQRTNG